MTSPTPREDFALAVASAISSIHHLYHEVYRLMSGLRAQLDEGPDSFAMLAGTFSKVGRDPARLIIRNEYGALFRRMDGDAEPDDEDEDTEDEADEQEDGGGPPTRKKRTPIQIPADRLLLAVRIVLGDPQRREFIEPRIDYALLGHWTVGNKPWDHERVFEVRKSSLRKIPPELGGPNILKEAWIPTKAVVASDNKGERRLACVLQTDIKSVPLFDLDNAEALDQLAKDMRQMWKESTTTSN